MIQSIAKEHTASPSGASINFNNGLMLSGTGVVSSGSGSLTVNNTTSGITGGSLTAASQYMAAVEGGDNFSRSGGSSAAGTLYLGYNNSDSGTYILSGLGLLSVTGLEYVATPGSEIYPIGWHEQHLQRSLAWLGLRRRQRFIQPERVGPVVGLWHRAGWRRRLGEFHSIWRNQYRPGRLEYQLRRQVHPQCRFAVCANEFVSWGGDFRANRRDQHGHVQLHAPRFIYR